MGANSKAIVPITLEYNKTLNDFERDTKKKINELNKEFDKLEKAIDAAMPEKGFLGDFSEARGELKQLRIELDQLKDSFDLSSINDQITELYAKIDARFKPLKKEVQDQLGDLLDGIGADTELGKLLKSVQDELGKSATAVEEFDKLKQKVDEVATSAETTKRTANRLRAEWKELDISKIAQLEAVMGNVDAKTERLARSLKEVQERLEAIASQHIDQIITDANAEDAKKSGKSSGKKVVTGATVEIDGEIFDKLKTESSGAASAVSELKAAASEASGAVKELAANVGRVPVGQVSAGGSVSLSEDSVRQLLGVIAQPQQVVVMANPQSIQKVKADIDEAIPEKKTVEIDTSELQATKEKAEELKRTIMSLKSSDAMSDAGSQKTIKALEADITAVLRRISETLLNPSEENIAKASSSVNDLEKKTIATIDSISNHVESMRELTESKMLSGNDSSELANYNAELMDAKTKFGSLRGEISSLFTDINSALINMKVTAEQVVHEIVPLQTLDRNKTNKSVNEYAKIERANTGRFTKNNFDKLFNQKIVTSTSKKLSGSLTEMLRIADNLSSNENKDPFGITSMMSALDSQIETILKDIGYIKFDAITDGSKESSQRIEQLRQVFQTFASTANEALTSVGNSLDKEASNVFGTLLKNNSGTNALSEKNPLFELYNYYNKIKKSLSGSGADQLKQFYNIIQSLNTNNSDLTHSEIITLQQQLNLLSADSKSSLDSFVKLKDSFDDATSGAGAFAQKLSTIISFLSIIDGKTLAELNDGANKSVFSAKNSSLKVANFDANNGGSKTLAESVFGDFDKAKDDAKASLNEISKNIQSIFDAGFMDQGLYNSLMDQIIRFTRGLETYKTDVLNSKTYEIESKTTAVKNATSEFLKSINNQLTQVQKSIDVAAKATEQKFYADGKLPDNERQYKDLNIAYNTTSKKNGKSFAQRITQLWKEAFSKRGKLTTDYASTDSNGNDRARGVTRRATINGYSSKGKKVSVYADVVSGELEQLNAYKIVEAQTALDNANVSASNLDTSLNKVNVALNGIDPDKVAQVAQAAQETSQSANKAASEVKEMSSAVTSTPQEVKYELTPQTNLNQEVEADVQTVETQKIPYVFVQSTGAGATGGVDLSSESGNFAALATAIRTDVIGAISEKNRELETEKGLVKTVTDDEIKNFEALGQKIQAIVDPLSKLLDALGDKKITVPDLAKILGNSKDISPEMYETLGKGIGEIKEALKNFDPDSFERFIIDISALKLGKGTLTNIENLGGSLKKLRDEFKAIDDTGSIGDLKFFQDIDLLLSRSKDLQNLATILKNVNSSAINTLKKSDQRTANEEVTVAYKKQIAAIKEYLKVYKQYKYGLVSEDDLTAAKNKKSAAKGGVTRALNKYGSDVTKDFSALRVQIDGLENSILSIDAEYTSTMQHISDATGSIAKDTADWGHAMSLLNDSDMFKDAIHNGQIYYDLLENIDKITRTARLDPTTGDTLVSYLMEDSSGNKLTLDANGNLLIEKANILDNTAAINQLTKAKEKLAVVEKKVTSNPDDVSTKYVSLYNQLNQQLTEIVAKYGEWSSFKPKTQEEALGFQLMANAISETVGELNLLTKAEQGTSEIKRIKLLEQIATWMDKNTKAAKTFAKELAEIQADINTQGADLDYNKTLNKFLSIKTAAAAGGNLGKTFWESFANRANYTLESALTQYLSLQDVVRYAQQAVSVINELDYALLDLKKTTAMSDAELEEFYYTSSDLAGQLGVTTQEIIELSSAWSRLGLEFY